MLNQVILVGVLTQQYSEKDDTYVTLKVSSTTPSTRGSSDEYDLIPCRIGKELSGLKEHLVLGVMIGVKAKITTHIDSDKITIDIQKITIISSGRDESE